MDGNWIGWYRGYEIQTLERMGMFGDNVVDTIMEKKFGGLKEQFQQIGTWDSFKEQTKETIKKQVDELERQIDDLKSQVTSVAAGIVSTTAAAAIPTSTVAAVGSAFQVMSMVKDLTEKLNKTMEKLNFLELEPPSVIETISTTIDTINSAIEAFPFP